MSTYTKNDVFVGDFRQEILAVHENEVAADWRAQGHQDFAQSDVNVTQIVNHVEGFAVFPVKWMESVSRLDVVVVAMGQNSQRPFVDVADVVLVKIQNWVEEKPKALENSTCPISTIHQNLPLPNQKKPQFVQPGTRVITNGYSKSFWAI